MIYSFAIAMINHERFTIIWKDILETVEFELETIAPLYLSDLSSIKPIHDALTVFVNGLRVSPLVEMHQSTVNIAFHYGKSNGTLRIIFRFHKIHVSVE